MSSGSRARPPTILVVAGLPDLDGLLAALETTPIFVERLDAAGVPARLLGRPRAELLVIDEVRATDRTAIIAAADLSMVPCVHVERDGRDVDPEDREAMVISIRPGTADALSLRAIRALLARPRALCN